MFNLKSLLLNKKYLFLNNMDFQLGLRAPIYKIDNNKTNSFSVTKTFYITSGYNSFLNYNVPRYSLYRTCFGILELWLRPDDKGLVDH